MARVRPEHLLDDHAPPAPIEQPSIDDRCSFMRRLAAARSLALEVPELDVVDPRRNALLDALQAEVGVFVVTEDILLAEAAERLEPVAGSGDEGARHRRHRPRMEELAGERRRSLAVVLDAERQIVDEIRSLDQHRLVAVEIHAAMHQRAVVVVERRPEDERLRRRRLLDESGVPGRPVGVVREDVGVDDQQPIAVRDRDGGVVRGAEAGIAGQEDEGDVDAIGLRRDPRVAAELLGEFGAVAHIDELVVLDTGPAREQGRLQGEIFGPPVEADDDRPFRPRNRSSEALDMRARRDRPRDEDVELDHLLADVPVEARDGIEERVAEIVGRAEIGEREIAELDLVEDDAKRHRMALGRATLHDDFTLTLRPDALDRGIDREAPEAERIAAGDAQRRLHVVTAGSRQPVAADGHSPVAAADAEFDQRVGGVVDPACYEEAATLRNRHALDGVSGDLTLGPDRRGHVRRGRRRARRAHDITRHCDTIPVFIGGIGDKSPCIIRHWFGLCLPSKRFF